MDREKKIEQKMKKVLTEGEMNVDKPEKEAVKQLRPKYEIRVQTMSDPIVEETQIFREYAEEVDDRYDEYLKKIPKPSRDGEKEKDRP